MPTNYKKLLEQDLKTNYKMEKWDFAELVFQLLGLAIIVTALLPFILQLF